MQLRTAKVAVAALGVVGMISFGSTLASANDGGGDEGHDHGGGGEETLPAPDLDPTSGPPGTVISIHGTDCFVSDEADFALVQGEEVLDSASAEVDTESGEWTGSLTVPDDDAFIGEELTVEAQCNPVYDPAVFTVTERPQPPTTPPPGGGGPPVTPAPTTPPGGGVAPAGGQPAAPSAPQPSPAAPAAPVSGQPSFTG